MLVPANIGVNVNEGCLYWLHTHDTSGIIQVESPVKNRKYTLGNFYDIWRKTLNDNKSNLKVYVNGKLYQSNPKDIVLKEHEQIVLEFGSKFLKQIPTFQFPSGV